MRPSGRGNTAEQWRKQLRADQEEEEGEEGKEEEEEEEEQVKVKGGSTVETGEVKTEAVDHPHPTGKCSVRMNSSGRTLKLVRRTSARGQQQERRQRMRRPVLLQQGRPMTEERREQEEERQFRLKSAWLLLRRRWRRFAPAAEDCPTDKRRRGL